VGSDKDYGRPDLDRELPCLDEAVFKGHVVDKCGSGDREGISVKWYDRERSGEKSIGLNRLNTNLSNGSRKNRIKSNRINKLDKNVARKRPD
jgi:hypothetical protein